MLAKSFFAILALAMAVVAAPMPQDGNTGNSGILGSILGSGNGDGSGNSGNSPGSGNTGNSGNIGSGNNFGVSNSTLFNCDSQTPNQTGLINIAKRALKIVGVRMPQDQGSSSSQNGVVNIGPLC